ncbi:MAG TPA: hypothetical protein VI454_06180 [Verrucomicrobiae bacterium]|jgi:hypothetical protein
MSCTILTSLIGPTVGGFLAGSVGVGLAWWKRGRDGRDRFHAVVGELQATLEGFDDMDERTVQFQRDSLPELRTAIFAVQPFIKRARFNRLRELLRDYKDEDFDWNKALVKRTAHQLTQGNDAPGEPPWATEKLREYLSKFRAEVG